MIEKMVSFHSLFASTLILGQPPRERARFLAGSLIIFFYSFPVICAAGNQILKPEQSGTIIVNIDNDAINSSDDNYTSGIQIGWLSGYMDEYTDGPIPEQVGLQLEKLPLIKQTDRQRYLSFSLSQRIFTPSDISLKEQIPNDTPYLALLLFNVTVCAQVENRLGAFTFTTGVAGPLAFGEETQKFAHNVTGDLEPQGWDNQISNEPIINFQYEQRFRINSFNPYKALKGDIIVPMSLHLGNMLSMGTTGMAFRFGWNTPDDFFIPPPFFGEESVGGLPFARKKNMSVYAFSMISGSLIGNAVFWDGNTFSDSASVDHNHLLRTVYSGVNADFEHWSITFTHVLTSVPWETPDKRSSEKYGHINIRCRF